MADLSKLSNEELLSKIGINAPNTSEKLPQEMSDKELLSKIGNHAESSGKPAPMQQESGVQSDASGFGLSALPAKAIGGLQSLGETIGPYTRSPLLFGAKSLSEGKTFSEAAQNAISNIGTPLNQAPKGTDIVDTKKLADALSQTHNVHALAASSLLRNLDGKTKEIVNKALGVEAELVLDATNAIPVAAAAGEGLKVLGTAAKATPLAEGISAIGQNHLVKEAIGHLTSAEPINSIIHYAELRKIPLALLQKLAGATEGLGPQLVIKASTVASTPEGQKIIADYYSSPGAGKETPMSRRVMRK